MLVAAPGVADTAFITDVTCRTGVKKEV